MVLRFSDYGIGHRNSRATESTYEIDEETIEEDVANPVTEAAASDVSTDDEYNDDAEMGDEEIVYVPEESDEDGGGSDDEEESETESYVADEDTG